MGVTAGDAGDVNANSGYDGDDFEAVGGDASGIIVNSGIVSIIGTTVSLSIWSGI